MSLGALFGSKTNSKSITKYTQLNIQTSSQDVPIPLVWGQKKMGTNIIWYNDFKAVPAKGGKKGGGGKGGEGKGGAASYDYFVAVILALCEGPITGIGTVWQDKTTTTLPALGFTLFTGTASQAVWSYLTANHPDQARTYESTAYIANSNYALGKSPNLPNHQFEIITPLSGSMPGTVDVNMADVLLDFLTNPQYSMGLTSGQVNSTDLTQYKTYIQAAGLFMSPDITNQEQSASVIDRWAQLTNSWIFWSGNNLRIVPLGDTPITANGATYTPITTVRFNFTEDDYVRDHDGIGLTVERADPADAPNYVRLEIKDRNNRYDTTTSIWTNQDLIDLYGRVDSPITQAHEICDPNVGQIVAQLAGLRYAYIRNTYKFKLGSEFGCVLEPGDIVTLSDTHIGLSQQPVRVLSLSEDDKGEWAVDAQELPSRIGTAEGTQIAIATTNVDPDYLASPGNVNPPAVFEPNSALTGTPQLWIAVSGGPNWGGAVVYVSFDDVNFYAVGTVSNPAYQGVTTADYPNHSAGLDNTDTLAIDTTQCGLALPTDATTADATGYRTLSILTNAYTTTIPSNGELIAYGTVTAGIGTYASNLTYIYRGIYGTSPADHPTGSFFTRVDLSNSTPPGNSVLIYELPAQYVGATVYLKFLSFNRFGNSPQTLSGVTTYQYTPSGAGFGSGTGGKPLTPSGLTGVGGVQQNFLSWGANAPTDNVIAYKLYRATGAGQPFGSATLIATVNALSYTDAGLLANQTYTYFLVAHNIIGDSPNTAGINVTTAGTLVAALRFYGFFPGKPPAGQLLLYNTMVGGESLPISLTGSIGSCSNAPTNSVTFPITKNGTAIGSMNIAAGATVPTFTFTAAVSFVAGDILEMAAPTPQDATLQNPSYTLIGTR